MAPDAACAASDDPLAAESDPTSPEPAPAPPVELFIVEEAPAPFEVLRPAAGVPVPGQQPVRRTTGTLLELPRLRGPSVWAYAPRLRGDTPPSRPRAGSTAGGGFHPPPLAASLGPGACADAAAAAAAAQTRTRGRSNGVIGPPTPTTRARGVSAAVLDTVVDFVTRLRSWTGGSHAPPSPTHSHPAPTAAAAAATPAVAGNAKGTVLWQPQGGERLPIPRLQLLPVLIDLDAELPPGALPHLLPSSETPALPLKTLHTSLPAIRSRSQIIATSSALLPPPMLSSNEAAAATASAVSAPPSAAAGRDVSDLPVLELGADPDLAVQLPPQLPPPPPQRGILLAPLRQRVTPGGIWRSPPSAGASSRLNRQSRLPDSGGASPVTGVAAAASAAASGPSTSGCTPASPATQQQQLVEAHAGGRVRSASTVLSLLLTGCGGPDGGRAAVAASPPATTHDGGRMDSLSQPQLPRQLPLHPSQAAAGTAPLISDLMGTSSAGDALDASAAAAARAVNPTTGGPPAAHKYSAQDDVVWRGRHGSAPPPVTAPSPWDGTWGAALEWVLGLGVHAARSAPPDAASPSPATISGSVRPRGSSQVAAPADAVHATSSSEPAARGAAAASGMSASGLLERRDPRAQGEEAEVAEDNTLAALFFSPARDAGRS